MREKKERRAKEQKKVRETNSKLEREALHVMM